jgi:hypothetical protein
MGCSTCKQKGKKEESVVTDDTLEINFVPKSVRENGLENGSIAFKIIAFIVVVIALPLVISVLVVQMFLHFFIPKALPKVSKGFKNFFVNLLNRYGKFRHDREVRKRKRQFEKNRGYEDGSDLVDVTDYEEYSDIEVHENNKEE